MPDGKPPREIRQARGSIGQSPDAGLARQLSELARQMQAEPDMAALLQRITDASLIEVEGAEHAGISLIEGKLVRTEAGTDDLMSTLDRQQHQLQQGPCLSSLREQITVRSDDLRHEDRWPKFAAAALEHGIHSMLAVQLFVEGDNLGALNLYASRPNAFTDQDESVAMLLAAHAAIAMKGSKVETNLRTALQSRDIIGQAKGILMERYKIGSLEAFDLLIAASQQTHRKLRDLAEALDTSGELEIN
jgi:GAF domain-containing protein